jgi:hypothetical protein
MLWLLAVQLIDTASNSISPFVSACIRAAAACIRLALSRTIKQKNNGMRDFFAVKCADPDSPPTTRFTRD